MEEGAVGDQEAVAEEVVVDQEVDLEVPIATCVCSCYDNFCSGGSRGFRGGR